MKRRAPELSQQYIQPLADVFKVLGDPTRLRILRVLMNQEVCVRDIADELGMGQSAVSHQLRILRDARLVQFRRDGKTIYYSLADNHVVSILNQGMEHIEEE